VLSFLLYIQRTSDKLNALRRLKCHKWANGIAISLCVLSGLRFGLRNA
jgi:hypothetical protein